MECLNFGQKRTRLMDDIDRDIAAGNLQSWDDAPDLIEPYPRGDVQVEGDEIERALQPGEAAFLDEDEVVSDLSDGEEQREGDNGPRRWPCPHRPSARGIGDRRRCPHRLSARGIGDRDPCNHVPNGTQPGGRRLGSYRRRLRRRQGTGWCERVLALAAGG